MRLFRSACLALATLIAPSPALATTGFDCEIEDASLSFFGGGTLGRSMGSPIIKFDADASIKVEKSPVSAGKIDLSKNLVHHWVSGDELSLHLYWEEGGSGDASLELVIQTKLTDDGITFNGDYKLTLSAAGKEPVEIAAIASCSAG
jgi:hypothetical protein